jgi:large subunit ribosomal protein L18
MISVNEHKRISRHERIRKTITGTTERPRLCVHRSIKNMQAQIIDDATGKVLIGKSTLAKDLRNKIKYAGNVSGAAVLGEALAAEAVKKGIKKVSFDRGGYLYHGRVKAFAEAARKGGLEF